MDASEQKELLTLARQSLGAALGVNPPPNADILRHKENHGAFVTLTEHGDLRGCIGTFMGTGPLGQTIANMAVAAGLQDPRFPKVSPRELPELHFEISLLSKTRPAKAEDIVLGEHGIVLKKGFSQSVFLPKVAIEQGWTKEETFRHLAQKARLPIEAWREANFEVFTAQVFEED